MKMSYLLFSYFAYTTVDGKSPVDKTRTTCMCQPFKSCAWSDKHWKRLTLIDESHPVFASKFAFFRYFRLTKLFRNKALYIIKMLISFFVSDKKLFLILFKNNNSFLPTKQFFCLIQSSFCCGHFCPRQE